MLGYSGRSNRRDFIGAIGLLIVGPTLVSMILQPSVPVLMDAMTSEVEVMLMGLALTLVVVLALVAMLWGGTVITVRRAADIGWPAWVGLVGTLAAIGASAFIHPSIGLIWPAALAGWPGQARKPDPFYEQQKARLV